MKQTINFSQFCDAFRDMDRNENYSYGGKRALYDYLEQLDEDCETETELDVIAICCEFTEYDDLEDFQENYGADNYPDLETIRDNTTVIEIEKSDRFIIQDF